MQCARSSLGSTSPRRTRRTPSRGLERQGSRGGSEPRGSRSVGLQVAHLNHDPSLGKFSQEPAMTLLIFGIILFFGVHSVRIFADSWRSAQIARIGEGPWKGLYALASIVGVVLLVWGFGRARAATVVLWSPPFWTHYVAAVLTLIAFVLVVAAYVPRTRIKSWLHHPMILGVKVWAFAHLISNGTLADVVLFGSFLAWAIADFAASRRRDRAAGTVYLPGTFGKDAVAVVIGAVAWALFAFW